MFVVFNYRTIFNNWWLKKVWRNQWIAIRSQISRGIKPTPPPPPPTPFYFQGSLSTRWLWLFIYSEKNPLLFCMPLWKKEKTTLPLFLVLLIFLRSSKYKAADLSPGAYIKKQNKRYARLKTETIEQINTQLFFSLGVLALALCLPWLDHEGGILLGSRAEAKYFGLKKKYLKKNK